MTGAKKAVVWICTGLAIVLFGVFGGEFAHVLPAATGWPYADVAFVLAVGAMIIVIAALVVRIITISDTLGETRQRSGAYLKELKARNALYTIRGALLILFAYENPEKDLGSADAWISGFVQAFGAKQIMACATDLKNPTLPSVEYLDGEAGETVRREIADWLRQHNVR